MTARAWHAVTPSCLTCHGCSKQVEKIERKADGRRHPLDSAGNKKRASIEPLVKLIQPDMERVNEAILSHAQSHVELIPEIANHLINSGGKRIRPMLTLAAARMCGYRGRSSPEARHRGRVHAHRNPAA